MFCLFEQFLLGRSWGGWKMKVEVPRAEVTSVSRRWWANSYVCTFRLCSVSIDLLLPFLLPVVTSIIYLGI